MFLIGIELIEILKRHLGEMNVTEDLLENLDPPAGLGEMTGKAVNAVRGEDKAPEVEDHGKREDEVPEVEVHVRRENTAPRVGEHVRRDLERRHDPPEGELLEKIRKIIILTQMNQRKKINCQKRNR